MLPSVDQRTLRWVTGDPCRDAVVVFWRSGCAPCYEMGREFERLSREFRSLTVVQVDVELAPRAVDRFDVRVVPTAIRFHHRVPAAASVGIMRYGELCRRLALTSPSL